MTSTQKTKSISFFSAMTAVVAGIAILSGCAGLPVDLEAEDTTLVASAETSHGSDVILTRKRTPRPAPKASHGHRRRTPKTSLTVREMQGPFASVEAYCTGANMSCDDTLGSLAGPSQIEVGRNKARIFRGSGFCHLGIERQGQWFVADKVAWCGTDDATVSSIRDINFMDIRENASSDLHLTLRQATGDGQLSELLMVCGSGDQGTPSCAYIPTSIEDLEASSRVNLAFHHDGRVSVRPEGKLNHAELQSILGTHKMLFP